MSRCDAENVLATNGIWWHAICKGRRTIPICGMCCQPPRPACLSVEKMQVFGSSGEERQVWDCKNCQGRA